MPRLARHIEVIATRVFLPAAVLLFVAGTAMTLQAWSFGQAWIAVSVALWVVSAVVGAGSIRDRASSGQPSCSRWKGRRRRRAASSSVASSWSLGWNSSALP